ncbi:MAG TPA: glycine C-acetyltransferase [Bryobacteraceae bacterium]|nr:glycine C-acetyltransferase [Bryobacteraceae bacterium]
MTDSFAAHLNAQLEEIRSSGLWKAERVLASPQSSRVRLHGGAEVMVLCANNYLGLANHPEISAAASEALAKWGYGMASVRFICGTQEIHKELESRISAFLKTDDTILYSSCFDANGGLFETILGAEDTVISDELNHASIIDGIRLCKAQRYRYKNCDMGDLEAKLKEASGARHKLIATDGVFSMDGYLAPLRDICKLADKYGALVMVDDSHAVGFMGPAGRGTPDHWGVQDRVDIVTGTLGKALGGASGGYTSGRKGIIDLLRQRSRPYLFSNSLAPAIVAASIKTLDLIERDTSLIGRIRSNTKLFRERMTSLGLDILPGEHPIVPVMLGDAVLAARMAELLLARGIYVTAFSYPVVPMGKARIRTQVSASHTPEQLVWAAQQFAEVRAEIGK